DDRSARGIDQKRAWLHAPEVLAPDQSARALAQHHVDGDDVGGRKQLLLAGVADARGLASFGGEVRTPGDRLHAERLCQTGDLGSQPAKADDTERLALDLGPDRSLQWFAGMHPRVLTADIAG